MKHVTFVSWSETPHLDPAAQAELAAAYMPHELKARTKGIPSLGAGAIYPIAEEDVIIDPFEIPVWFTHCYGLDVGWNRTAAIWAARDLEKDIVYLYDEWYRGQAEPPVHAAGIRARGEWIPGVIDPAARGRGQKDGEQLLQNYIDLGLTTLTTANNAVEAGLHSVYMRLVTGRLRVFKTMQNWLQEFRLYRRNDKGEIVKVNDHAMDATRYLCLSGLSVAIVKPPDFGGRLNQAPRFQAEYNPFAGRLDPDLPRYQR